jgi:hypothetical protein
MLWLSSAMVDDGDDRPEVSLLFAVVAGTCLACSAIFVKIQTARGTSLAVSVHLGTSLRYVDQVPKCPKVVHLGLDHVQTL